MTCDGRAAVEIGDRPGRRRLTAGGAGGKRRPSPAATTAATCRLSPRTVRTEPRSTAPPPQGAAVDDIPGEGWCAERCRRSGRGSSHAARRPKTPVMVAMPGCASEAGAPSSERSPTVWSIPAAAIVDAGCEHAEQVAEVGMEAVGARLQPRIEGLTRHGPQPDRQGTYVSLGESRPHHPRDPKGSAPSRRGHPMPSARASGHLGGDTPIGRRVLEFVARPFCRDVVLDPIEHVPIEAFGPGTNRTVTASVDQRHE